ncbi:MAG: tol-pal system protein YbgF [Myxococcota bacterium]
MSILTGRVRRALIMAIAASFATGCVTVAEFRKLERQVIDVQRGRNTGETGHGLADLAAEMDALAREIRQLQGRVEVVEKTARDALAEARRLRQELAGLAAESALPNVAKAGGKSGAEPWEVGSEELRAYRAAYASWRVDEHPACIDQFRKFLQTYPASAYADDAAFWMADCHFKKGDYKNAVLRFDDVVNAYPNGNKAPDALYRQGESLLKLGPGYHDAAKRAFQRVLKEYPDSGRVSEANRQIELLAAG